MFIVIAVMVVVAAAGVVGYSVLSNKKPASTPATTDNKPAETNATADVIPRDDGQLNLSAKLDTASAIKEQTVKAKIKEQINLSSGFSFMATKIEAFTPNDTAVKPADGKKFVVVSAAVGNRAQTNAISISYLDFKLRDNDNKLLPGHPSTQAILGNILANPTSIKPGEQVTGRIVYEVNATDTSWVLVHKETYQKTTDNTTFTLAGEEVVSLTPAPSTPPATTPPLLHPNF